MNSNSSGNIMGDLYSVGTSSHAEFGRLYDWRIVRASLAAQSISIFVSMFLLVYFSLLRTGQYISSLVVVEYCRQVGAGNVIASRYLSCVHISFTYLHFSAQNDIESIDSGGDEE